MTSHQLSLFDTATVIQPAYKVGDLVKIRKRPIGASYVKKGDVVEIAAVHPLNGSIKFWNERSECWEFLHPDEIGSIVSPDDTPTPAEVAVRESIPHSETLTTTQLDAVGESNCPPDGFDSPTPAEVVVGESNCPPDGFDSPTPAEVVVGESNCLPSDIDYLDPISAYKPRGTARGNENYRYYRLSYKEGNKVRQIHIRGGNTDSPIAQAKVQEVRSLLAAGISPQEIAKLLKST